MKKIIIAILILTPLFGSSYYLYEDFGADGTFVLSNSLVTPVARGYNGWTNNFWYGREGVIIPKPDDGTGNNESDDLTNEVITAMSRQHFTNGKLEIIGSPSPGDLGSSRDGRWKGKWVWNTNRYKATPYIPFGWEIIRERAFLDPSSLPGGGVTAWVPGATGTKVDARKHSTLGIAMYYDDPASPLSKTYDFDRANEYAAFQNYFEFVEHAGCWGQSNYDVRRYFEYFESAEVQIDNNMTNTLRPDGGKTNVLSFLTWDYDLTNNVATNTASATNTNAIGFRMIHDGTNLSLYVNPNPYATVSGRPSEWLLVVSRPVTWNSNFSFMVGHQQRGFGGYLGDEWAFGTFDNLLIKSAADSSTLLFEPSSTQASNGFQTVKLILSNVLLPTTNSGINYIRIIKPSVFAWDTNNISVSTRYDGSTHSLSMSTYASGKSFADTEAYILTNYGEDEVRIILGAQITNMTVASNEHIEISIPVKITNDDFPDYAFSVYVMAEVFSDMPVTKKSNYSTCGFQRVSGDGKIKYKYVKPEAYSSITPTSIYQGNTTYSFFYRLAAKTTSENQGQAPIKKAAIQMPPPFDNTNINIYSSNFNSLKMGDASSWFAINDGWDVLYPTQRTVADKHSGDDSFLFDEDTDEIIINSSTYPGTLKLWLKGDSGGAQFLVEKATSNADGYGSWTTASTLTTTTSWAEYTVDLSASTHIYIRLRRQTAANFYLDDVSWDEGKLPGRFITIDYSSNPINAGGVDIYEFKTIAPYTTNYETNTAYSNRMREWKGYIASNSFEYGFLETEGSSSYPARDVTVNPAGAVNRAFDIQVVRAKNAAPASVKLSNETVLNYVDITADGFETNTEAIESMLLTASKISNNIAGEIMIYRSDASKAVHNATSGISSSKCAQFTTVYDGLISPRITTSGTTVSLNLKTTNTSGTTFYVYQGKASTGPWTIIKTCTLTDNNWASFSTTTTLANVYLKFASHKDETIYLDDVSGGEIGSEGFEASAFPPAGWSSRSHEDFITNVKALSAPLAFSAPTTNYTATLTASNNIRKYLSTSASTPTRFWVTINIKSGDSGMYGDSLSLYCTDITGAGYDGGVVDGETTLVSVVNNMSRIDKYVLNVSTKLHTSITNDSTIAQGSSDNPYLQLTFSQDDPDAVYHLSQVKIRVRTDAGVTLSHSRKAEADISAFKFMKDAGPGLGVYNASEDTEFAMSGVLDIDKDSDGLYDTFTVTTFPPVEVSGTADVTFWGLLNLKDTAVADDTLGLYIETSSDIEFWDSYTETSCGIPSLSVSTNWISATAQASKVVLRSQNVWDVYLNDIKATSPSSMKPSNDYAMLYFDLVRDEWAAQSEYRLQNCSFAVSGLPTALKGTVSIYRDRGDMSSFSQSVDGPAITNISLSDIRGTNSFADFSETGLSKTFSSPSRFWLTLKIDEQNAVAYSNSLALSLVKLYTSGPRFTYTNPDNVSMLSTFTPSTSRVDKGQFSVSTEVISTEEPRQGTFNNPYLKLTLNTDDPDDIGYLSSLIVTNSVSSNAATSSDFGTVRLFQDTDGTDGFNAATDTPVMQASMNTTSNIFILTGSSDISVNSTSKVFYVAYDIALRSTEGRKVSLQVSNIKFKNGSETYGNVSPAASVIGTTTYLYPQTAGVERSIGSYLQQPFDFSISRMVYTVPSSFTTNQVVPFGYFEIYQDIDLNILTFQGANISVSGARTNITGILSLYRKSTPPTLEDTALGSVSISNGTSSYTVSCSMTNTTMNPFAPDRIYVAFKLSGDINTMKSDNIGFKVNSVNATGTDNVVDNTNVFSTASLQTARVDSYRIEIEKMDNDIIRWHPNQNSKANPYIRLHLRGDDPDGTNYLKYIDLKTNANSELFTGMIPYIRLYINTNTNLGYPTTPEGKLELSSAVFDSGQARIDLGTTPLALASTNLYELFVGYDVDFSSSVIGKKFGLELTNIFAIDNVADGFEQTPYFTGKTSGPTNITNVLIVREGAKWWDVKITRVDKRAPAEALENVEIPLYSFDVYREEQTSPGEYVYGLSVSNEVSNSGPFSGYINIYTNSPLASEYTDRGSAVSKSNYISSTNSGIDIRFENIYVSGSADTPTRFFVTYLPLSYNTAVTNNIRITDLKAYGFDYGLVDNVSLFTNAKESLISLQKNAVNASLTSLLPTLVKQGSENIVALKLNLAADDDDAVYQLNNLTFALSGGLGSNDVANCSVYIDSGDTKNSFDSADRLLAGAALNGGKLTSLFEEASIPIDKTGTNFYLMINIGKDANPGSVFTISFNPSDQSGFTPLTIDGKTYSVGINSYSPSSTTECEIERQMFFQTNNFSVAAPSIISPSSGDMVHIELKENASDYTQYKALIYDGLGVKVKEIEFTSEKADWDGSEFSGELVAPGVYLVVVTGPDSVNKFVIAVKR